MKNRAASTNDSGYRLAELLVAIIGFREGVITIVLKLIGRDQPNWMALPLYLPSPWCYLVATGVVVVAFLALVALDKARLTTTRADRPERESPDTNGQST